MERAGNSPEPTSTLKLPLIDLKAGYSPGSTYILNLPLIYLKTENSPGSTYILSLHLAGLFSGRDIASRWGDLCLIPGHIFHFVVEARCRDDIYWARNNLNIWPGVSVVELSPPYGETQIWFPAVAGLCACFCSVMAHFPLEGETVYSNICRPVPLPKSTYSKPFQLGAKKS